MGGEAHCVQTHIFVQKFYLQNNKIKTSIWWFWVGEKVRNISIFMPKIEIFSLKLHFSTRKMTYIWPFFCAKIQIFGIFFRQKSSIFLLKFNRILIPQTFNFLILGQKVEFWHTVRRDLLSVFFCINSIFLQPAFIPADNFVNDLKG